MSFRSVAAKNLILRMVGVMTVAGAALVVGVTNESLVHAQSPSAAAKPGTPPKVRLPDESAGIDAIARTLVSAFDQVDIVALGEAHGRRLDSDLRIAVVRHPDFAKKVRSIVVEFGSTTEQATLDRYVRGESISRAQLEQVWKTTTQAGNGVWDSSIYAEFFAAVREVNAKLPADVRVRVFGGDPGPGDTRSREIAAVAVLKEQVLEKHGKALVIYGAAHFYRTLDKDYLSSMGDDIGIVRMLDMAYPGRTFAVIPVGGSLDLPPGVTLRIQPDYRKFDRALQMEVRPVLVSLERPPFRDFSTEEFIGGHVLTCRGTGGCRSIFQGSTLTLGQMADACVYVGGAADVDTRAKAAQ
jgi:heme-binding uptake protein ChaN (Tiki superfamily)